MCIRDRLGSKEISIEHIRQWLATGDNAIQEKNQALIAGVKAKCLELLRGQEATRSVVGDDNETPVDPATPATDPNTDSGRS